jgi:hypothetical protein
MEDDAHVSLRDYFAGQAIQGLIIRKDRGSSFDFITFPEDPVRFGHWAYDIADAMMEARKAPKKGITERFKRNWK